MKGADMSRQQKQAVFRQLKLDYNGLKQTWQNDSRYDVWMAQSLNNAHLALVATYHELVPTLEIFLRKADGDLPTFYKQMEELAALPKHERHEQLANITKKEKNGD